MGLSLSFSLCIWTDGSIDAALSEEKAQRFFSWRAKKGLRALKEDKEGLDKKKRRRKPQQRTNKSKNNKKQHVQNSQRDLKIGIARVCIDSLGGLLPVRRQGW